MIIVTELVNQNLNQENEDFGSFFMSINLRIALIKEALSKDLV